MNNQRMWVDVIEDVPETGCYNMTTIPVYGPLPEGETLREWLVSHGFYDIVDFRVVTDDQVTRWASPELEWVWIEATTEPYILCSPPMN